MRAIDKILYILPATILLGLSSCIRDQIDTAHEPQSNRIRFEVTTPGLSAIPGSPTRAAETTTENFDGEFKLWAIYQNENTVYADATITMTSEPFTTHLFWPEAEKNLHFFALHPSSLDNITSNPKVSVNATGKSLTFDFKVASEASAQTDLLTACKSVGYKAVVPLDFQHALTRITFDAQCDGFEGKEVKLTGIVITGANDTSTGTLTGSGFSWGDKTMSATNNTGTFTLSPIDLTLNGTLVPVKASNTPSGEVYENMFLLPHDDDDLTGVKLKVTFTVAGEADEKFHEVELKDIVAHNDIMWEKGKWVNYQLTIKPGEVDVDPYFRVTRIDTNGVLPWDGSTIATFEVDTNIEGWTVGRTVQLGWSGGTGPTLSISGGGAGKTTFTLTFLPYYSVDNSRSVQLNFTVNGENKPSEIITQTGIIPFAPPGVIGYFKNAEGKYELTLRGSKEYKDTPVDFEGEGEFGPLENETVYVAYFKWGSLIAIGNSEYGRSFNENNVICGPSDSGYSLSNLITRINNATTNIEKWEQVPYTNADGWLGNAANGLGDPCAYYFNGKYGGNWRLPTATSTSTPIIPIWHYSGGSPFGTEGANFPLTNGVKYFSAGNFDLPIAGAVAGDGSGGQDWRMFLPCAGSRNCDDGYILTQGSQGSYWSSTVYQNGLRLITFNGWDVNPAQHYSIYDDRSKYGLAVRCVSR